jgi:hypothetical protein
LWVVGLLLSGSAGGLGAQDGIGWTFRSSPGADLWFHGLAVIGLDVPGTFPALDPEYASAVRQAKEAAGVYPTALDQQAERLRDEFRKDPAFQVFQFVPLYFADVPRDRMFSALRAVADGRLGDTELIDRTARPGVGAVARALTSGGQRRALGRLLDLLDVEWQGFYESYWSEHVEAGLASRVAAAGELWSDQIEPAAERFFRARRIDRGIVLVSPAVGPEGRLDEGVPASRSDNVIAAPLPLEGDVDATVFGALYQACYAIVAEALRAPGVIASDQAGVATAVRCGERLLGRASQDLARRYVETFTRLAPANRAKPGSVDFAEAYALDPALERALDVLTETAAGPRARAGRPNPDFGWVFRPQPHTDLWFHTLAVISADDEGPLGLYSADYARRVRDAKRDAGVYPTPLDSAAPRLRDLLRDDRVTQIVHFVPLYLAQVQPDRFLDVLRNVEKGNLDALRALPPDMGPGLQQLVFGFEDRTNRRALRELIAVMDTEWEVFFKNYWERTYEEHRDYYEEIQRVWDDEIGAQLGQYLENRRLTSGLVLLSASLGPEGRISDPDAFDPRDQVAAVYLPIWSDDPAVPIFFFVKELCFLLVDDGQIARFAGSPDEREDLRRRAAVRCGAMVLEFYAPVLAMRYRRAFLDAVGAEESSTVTAFERVYFIDAEVLNVIRDQVRRDR